MATYVGIINKAFKGTNTYVLVDGSGNRLKLQPYEYPTAIRFYGEILNEAGTYYDISIALCCNIEGKTHEIDAPKTIRANAKPTVSPYGGSDPLSLMNSTMSSSQNEKLWTIFAQASGPELFIKRHGVTEGYWNPYYNTGRIEIDTAFWYTKIEWEEKDKVIVPDSPYKQGNSFTLEWGKGKDGIRNDITGYHVQYADSSDGSTFGSWKDLVKETAGTSYAALPNGTRGAYRKFQVQIQGTAGKNYYSDWKESAVLRTNLLPNKVTGLAVDPSKLGKNKQTTTLTWTAPAIRDTGAKIARYYYSYCTKTEKATKYSGWSEKTEACTAKKTSLSQTPELGSGTKIKYRICAEDEVGDIGPWTESEEVLRNKYPGKPTNVTAAPATWSSGKISLSWTPPAIGSLQSEIQKYRVYCKYPGLGDEYEYCVETAQTSAEIAAPSMSRFGRGETIHFGVKAIDLFEDESEYGLSNNVLRNNVPPAVISLTANPASIYFKPDKGKGIITLTWTIPEGSDENVLTYQIQYAISSNGTKWGNWIDLATTTKKTYKHVSPENEVPAGNFIKYRVYGYYATRTEGASRETAAIINNRAPLDPGFGFSYSTIKSLRPLMQVNYSKDPDGQNQTIHISARKSGVSADAWSKSLNVGNGAGSKIFRMELGSPGTYTISVYVNDGHQNSETKTKTITVSEMTFLREIKKGTIIANETISHVADIAELITLMNAKRSCYGLGSLSIPNEGYFKTWTETMQRIANGVRELYNSSIEIIGLTSSDKKAQQTYDCAGVVAKYSPTVPNWPTAAVINHIKEILKEA